MADAIQVLGRAIPRKRTRPRRDYFIEALLETDKTEGLLRDGERVIAAGAFGVSEHFSSSVPCRRIIIDERSGSQYFVIIGRPRR
jgi:hypothetical protein